MTKNKKRKNGTRKVKAEIIAERKTCSSDGTGLSHYILMDKKTR